ncbi:hypothetical protein AGLY_014207 [Aphis glycines]|uniref:CCHC-type domain-containing protein n=1 Tax=Aphis glycines TaxID=307491 RepID=A0A6G0T4L8_APHGL|nr:hypothetical protein AGLY_014207 [Aphis glycines]
MVCNGNRITAAGPSKRHQQDSGCCGTAGCYGAVECWMMWYIRMLDAVVQGGQWYQWYRVDPGHLLVWGQKRLWLWIAGADALGLTHRWRKENGQEKTGENGNGKNNKGQLVDEREGAPFVFTGSLGEETSRRSNKRLKDDEGEGVDRFTYGAGSIVDTVELRDYTCILGRRGREISDELLRLIMAMKTEKASMTKAREEAFKKTRTGLMNAERAVKVNIEPEKKKKKKKKKSEKKKSIEGPPLTDGGSIDAKASTSKEEMAPEKLLLVVDKAVEKQPKKPKKGAEPVPKEKGRKRAKIPVRPLPAQQKPKTSEWTTEKRKDRKRNKSKKRVVPDEVRIFLEETQKARENKYGGYVLNWAPKIEEGSEKPKVTPEVTEAQMIKNLWEVLSKKKCAPRFKRLKKVGKDRLYAEPENEETRKLLQKASLDIRRAGERNPHIIVHGVGSEVKDDEIAVLLEEQNESSVTMAPGWFKSLELISHKSRITRKGRDVEFVATPEVGDQIVGQTLCVGLSWCRVGPSVNVRRCHRCHRYGHTGAICKAPSVVWLTSCCALCCTPSRNTVHELCR